MACPVWLCIPAVEIETIFLHVSCVTIQLQSKAYRTDLLERCNPAFSPVAVICHIEKVCLGGYYACSINIPAGCSFVYIYRTGRNTYKCRASCKGIGAQGRRHGTLQCHGCQTCTAVECICTYRSHSKWNSYVIQVAAALECPSPNGGNLIAIYCCRYVDVGKGLTPCSKSCNTCKVGC